MSVNSKMTAIADKIRVLSGTEDAMGLDAMATHIGEANTNVSTEAGLIAQIQTALQNKAAGSTGSGSVDTCTIKIINNITGLGHTVYGIGYSALNDGKISAVYLSEVFSAETEIILNNVVCGSLLHVNHYGYKYVSGTLSGGLVDLDNITPLQYFMVPTENGAVGIISLEDWE